MKYNILTKNDPEKSYIILDFIATNLSEKEFAKIQEMNTSLLKDYKFIKFDDTDFTWWQHITKFLTKNKLYYNTYFEIDFYGNVYKY